MVPVFLLKWVDFEAKYHDTLECRRVLETYLIAAAGCMAALLAGIGSKTFSARLLQVR